MSHPATARICPAYHTAIETLKPKIATQLAHYINPDDRLTPDNTNGTEIFRSAALASKTADEFLLSLFNSCKQFTDKTPTQDSHAQQEQIHNFQLDTDNTSITATQAQIHHTQPQQQTHDSHPQQTHDSHSQQTHDSHAQEKIQQPQRQTYEPEAQHPFHSEKQPIHKFCVDASKHLMRNPIPNRVVRLTEHVYSDLPEATSHTMSSLRNYDSDTDRNLTDEYSFSISESDNVSQAHSPTKYITFEHQSPLEAGKYIMILEGDRLCRWFGSYPLDLEESCIRLKLEYWSELIGCYDEHNYCTLDLETAKDYCLEKINLGDIDIKLNRYYTKALGYLNRLKTRSDKLHQNTT